MLQNAARHRKVSYPRAAAFQRKSGHSLEMRMNNSYDPNVFALLKYLLQAIRDVILESREDPAYSPQQTTTYLVPDLSLWWNGTNSQPYPPVFEKPRSFYKALAEHVERLIPAPAFQFKGSGWYATDYARPQSSKPGDSAPNGDKAESKLSDSKTEKPATETKSESKSESKTESKPTSTVKKD